MVSRAQLRWSNAGHPPVVLLGHDVAAPALWDWDVGSELLLGIEPSVDRSDSEVVLAPGSTLLPYADGLVER